MTASPRPARGGPRPRGTPAPATAKPARRRAPAAPPILVTGGAGFIGSHLVATLVREGARVRVLDDLSTGRRANLPDAPAVQLLVGDIRDAALCRRACRGVELVFHLAARASVPASLADPLTTDAVNAGGTLNLLEAARQAGCRRLVYASSTAVYGSQGSDRPGQRLGEDLPPRPLSPYAASKAAGEAYARCYHASFDLPAIGLRYFNVYGPRQDPASAYAAAVPRFFCAVLAGAEAVIYGDGQQTRDFVHVSDVVAANLAAARAPATAGGQVFNIAGGAAISVTRLLDAIGAACGRPAPRRHEPGRAGEVRHSRADIGLARRVLGWRPRLSLAAGLADTSAYYASL